MPPNDVSTVADDTFKGEILKNWNLVAMAPLFVRVMWRLSVSPMTLVPKSTVPMSTLSYTKITVKYALKKIKLF